MKTKIKVSFGIKFRIKDFEMAEESDGLEIELDVADEAELTQKYDYWQNYIQNKVIKAAFEGANKYVEERKVLFG